MHRAVGPPGAELDVVLAGAGQCFPKRAVDPVAVGQVDMRQESVVAP